MNIPTTIKGQLGKLFYIPSEIRDNFILTKFRKNTYRIILISVFLFFEQLFYGLVLTAPSDPQRNIFFYTAIGMLVFGGLAIYFIKKKTEKINVAHSVFQVAAACFGMIAALRRLAVTEFVHFYVPTVYIAVVYGIAVIFFLNYLQSAALYLTMGISTIIMIPLVHPHITDPVYIADIVSNILIAWIISCMNYHNFLKNFINRHEIEQVNQKLHSLSIRDPLTALYNRRKLDEILLNEFKRSSRYGLHCSIILLDIDYFKRVNDQHGHIAGDSVLKEFVTILSETKRNTDYFGRWGGEEFLLICPQSTLENCHTLAERMRKIVESHTFNITGSITASFGISSGIEVAEIEALLRLADERLYIAKSRGRNMVVSKS